MDRLEESLRQALRRKDAPEGLADRVLARIAAPRPGPWAWLGFPALRWAVAVIIPFVVLFAVQYNAERRRRAEGEMAKERVVTAMRIAAGKFEYTRQKLQRATGRTERAGRPVNSI